MTQKHKRYILHYGLFIVLCAVALTGFVFEFVNPHSMLDLQGAYIRALLAFTGFPVWIWFSRRANGLLLKQGCMILGLLALMYFYYAYNLQYENALYEQQKNTVLIDQSIKQP
jgi:hypothetical protein